MAGLKLRRATVVEAGDPEAPFQRLAVEIAGARRPAVADTVLVGPAQVGDDVVLNTQALDLGLGSGGFDVVHANLTRGLEGEGTAGAHVMKLNYTSLQHAVMPVEAEAAPSVGISPPVDSLAGSLEGSPAAMIFNHGQLAPVCWGVAQVAPGARVGFVQTPGGALPGGLSEVVRELRARDLLAGHVTAGAAFGGEGEAITTAGAIHHGLRDLGWDAAVTGPGPGVIGSGSALGHGGLYALDSAHVAIALGCRALIVPRLSSGDARPRHQGLSHHTGTVLRLLLAPATVAVPEGLDVAWPAQPIQHVWRSAPVDLDGYSASGLPTRTMGRDLEEDRAFFAAALAGGVVLGEMVREAAPA